MTGPPARTVGDGPPAISVRNVTKRYGTGADAVTAVDDASFDVERGSVVGVLGPNGAGKTTLIKSILDLVVPTAGTIEVAGTPTGEYGPELYAEVCAVLEGARNVYWRLTVRENVDFFTGLQGIDPADVAEENAALVDSFGLTRKADRPVNTLSQGMKQKVALACALARRTPIVFLDEPTLGLDVEASATLLDRLESLIESHERTVVLSSHDMDVVERLCDRVVILKEGRVVVDDEVAALLDLFRTRQYRLQVAGDVPAATVERLADRYVAVETEALDGTTALTVGLADRDRIFDLMRDVERAGLTVESMRTVEPSFEDVFLDVVTDPPAAAPAVAGGAS